MTRNEVFEKMTEICKDIFDNENLVITEQTTAADVEEWDSLTHLSLVDELEEIYDIEFLLDEVSLNKSVSELLDAIIKHIEEK